MFKYSNLDYSSSTPNYKSRNSAYETLPLWFWDMILSEHWWGSFSTTVSKFLTGAHSKHWIFACPTKVAFSNLPYFLLSETWFMWALPCWLFAKAGSNLSPDNSACPSLCTNGSQQTQWLVVPWPYTSTWAFRVKIPLGRVHAVG